MNASKRYILTFSLFSAGYIALGLLLLLAPDQSRQFLSIALGIAAIVAGIARIAWHFAKDDLSRAFHNDIPGGVLLVLAGIYLIARAEVLWDWLPVILGFAVVFDSMVKLQHAFDLKRTGFAHWWAVLALALATAVLGLLLVLGIFGKNILLYYFGAVLIADGAANLVTILALALHIRRTEKESPPTPPGEDEPPEDDGNGWEG